MIKTNPELVVLDDVLNQEDYDMVMREINAHRGEMMTQIYRTYSKPDFDYAAYSRWYPKFGAIVTTIFDNAIFNKRVFDIAKSYHDLSWKWYCCKVANRFEVQATSYKKSRDDKYGWHVDHNSPEYRVLNCIIYLTDTVGGELQIADKFDLVGDVDEDANYTVLKTIQPKKNRMAIIPSWYIHRVQPLMDDSERLTLNGHVVVSEEGITSVSINFS